MLRRGLTWAGGMLALLMLFSVVPANAQRGGDHWRFVGGSWSHSYRSGWNRYWGGPSIGFYFAPAPVYVAPEYGPVYRDEYVPAYEGPVYYGPDYYGPAYYGPSYYGPSFGLSFDFGGGGRWYGGGRGYSRGGSHWSGGGGHYSGGHYSGGSHYYNSGGHSGGSGRSSSRR